MKVDLKKLEKALLKSKMSWGELVKRAGISPVTLWYIKQGKTSNNQMKVIVKLSNALGVEPEEIVKDLEE